MQFLCIQKLTSVSNLHMEKDIKKFVTFAVNKLKIKLHI